MEKFSVKLKNLMVLTLMLFAGCAAPVIFYEEVKGYDVLWDMDPMGLNCKQLNEARIKTSSTIDQLAERIIENSNRSTAASRLGLTVGNPERGENFVGLRSSGVSPEVNEFRKLKVLKEQIEELQIQKCIRQSLEN